MLEDASDRLLTASAEIEMLPDKKPTANLPAQSSRLQKTPTSPAIRP